VTNWLDIKYSRLRDIIEEQLIEFNDDYYKTMAKLDEIGFMSLKMVCGLDDFTREDLIKIVKRIIEDKAEKQPISKLGVAIKSDAKIPTDSGASWVLYKKNLIKKGLSEDSIESIQTSAFEILQHLSMDTNIDGAVKGLVIGNVQSGKTANMAGLMAMAADNGFNYFVVLSGVIENLRRQTASRLYEDLKGNGNLQWNSIENPSVRSRDPQHNFSQIDLKNHSRQRYFTVCLKNSKRLKDLFNWLQSDDNKAKGLKVLIIDDEADQASINTKDIDEEQSKINNLIRDFVNSEKNLAMNYIAYTATPFANILNETSKESLYPKDFIYVLETSGDYIGPTQIFGTQWPEIPATLDIVRDLSASDKQIINDIQNGEIDNPLPKGFTDAINWFLLTVASLRYQDYSNPISMLVHTSFKVDHHNIIAKKIKEYLVEFKDKFELYLPQLKKMYQNESLDFKKSFFLKTMKNYSAKENVPDYPKWEDILPYLQRVVSLEGNEYLSHIPMDEEGRARYHKGIHLVIDNSRAKAEGEIVRLVYPRKNEQPSVAPAFIVVGGNTLSRGLTLEGLTTTVFLRTTNQADTLMQMARWFGYRKGYEIYPRVWMDHAALERFHFLAQINEEVREEIESMAKNGQYPMDYAPRVRNSPNYQLIRITSANKMQAARVVQFDFSGFNTQTVYFDNDISTLKHNLSYTKQFLNSLEHPDINKSHLIWRDVDVSVVQEFLSNYKYCISDMKMNSISALIKWIQENYEEFSNWNIVLASKGELKHSVDSTDDWKIHNYVINPIKRSKYKHRSSPDIANIGALRTPFDLIVDIEEELSSDDKKVAKMNEIYSLRERHGLGKTPQLVIYKIDKNNDSNESNIITEEDEQNKNARVPLNFPVDVIGINILIPQSNENNLSKEFISANLSYQYDEDLSIYEENEGENNDAT